MGQKKKMWISEEFFGSDESLSSFCGELFREMARLAEKHGIIILGGDTIKEDLKESETAKSPFPV